MEKEIDKTMENLSIKDTAAVVSTQPPTQILQREHNIEHSSAVLTPSPVLKVQPRVKQSPTSTSTNVEKPVSAVTASPHSAAAGGTLNKDDEPKQRPAVVHGDQKTENIIASNVSAQKTSGVGAARGSGGIPVAVVQPNAQSKQPK